MSSTRSAPTTTRLPLLGLAAAVMLSAGLVGATTTSASAGSATSQYGTLSAPDGSAPAPNQCGVYSYSYDLKPPPGDWALETFVVDPRGARVSAFVAAIDYSPGGAAGTTSFTLCRNNTRIGVFTINAQISSDDGTGTVTTYQMAPTTFSLGLSAKERTAQQRKAQKKAAQRAAHQKAKRAKKRAEHRAQRDD